MLIKQLERWSTLNICSTFGVFDMGGNMLIRCGSTNVQQMLINIWRPGRRCYHFRAKMSPISHVKSREITWNRPNFHIFGDFVPSGDQHFNICSRLGSINNSTFVDCPAPPSINIKHLFKHLESFPSTLNIYPINIKHQQLESFQSTFSTTLTSNKSTCSNS